MQHGQGLSNAAAFQQTHVAQAFHYIKNKMLVSTYNIITKLKESGTVLRSSAIIKLKLNDLGSLCREPVSGKTTFGKKMQVTYSVPLAICILDKEVMQVL